MCVMWSPQITFSAAGVQTVECLHMRCILYIYEESFLGAIKCRHNKCTWKYFMVVNFAPWNCSVKVELLKHTFYTHIGSENLIQYQIIKLQSPYHFKSDWDVSIPLVFFITISKYCWFSFSLGMMHYYLLHN